MPHLVVDKNPVGSFKEKENMGKEGQTKAKGQTKAHARKSSNQGTFKEKDKPRHIQGKGQTKTHSRKRTKQDKFKEKDKPKHIQVDLRTNQGIFKSI